MDNHYIRRLIAFGIALIVFAIQKQLGVFVIVFLLVDVLLKEKFVFNLRTSIYIICAIVFFLIGHKLSASLTLSYYSFIGESSFSFTGGFIGGIIELETYLFFSLIPMKWIIYKNLVLSLKSTLKVAIACFLIGGFVQGTYLAGWQGVYI